MTEHIFFGGKRGVGGTGTQKFLIGFVHIPQVARRQVWVYTLPNSPVGGLTSSMSVDIENATVIYRAC